ncbi:MAG TPA: tetratricopeptide repeat protein [Allosphingosinicella sp.]
MINRRALAFLAMVGVSNALPAEQGRSPAETERTRQLAMLTPAYQKAHGCLAGQKDQSASMQMPLIEGLAPVHLPIAAGKAAQRYFDQGLALLYGFEHAKAERSFEAALKIESGCAMCRWGQALSMGPHINSGPMSAERAKAAHRLVADMLRDTHLSPVERDMGEALLQRFAPSAPADQKGVHEEAYASMLLQASRRHPQSDFLLVLASEAAMNVHPWDYWEEGGERLKPWGGAARRLLSTVLGRSERHPQALHLFIHLTEASANPGVAETAADRLRQLVPHAAHLQHMPGHTYYRIGRFSDAVAVNRNAVAADEAMARTLGEDPLFYNYYRHHTHFILSSAQQIGDRSAGLAAAEGLEKAIPAERALNRPDYRRMLASALQARLQLSSTDELLAIKAPDERLSDLRLVWRAVRAQALARSHRLREAQLELVELRRLRRSVVLDPQMLPLIDMGERLAAARILSAQGDAPGAAALFKAAEQVEDASGYWEPPLWGEPAALHFGAALLRDGDPKGALSAFKRALRRRPGNAWALLGIARSQEAMRMPSKKASDSFRRVWRGPADLATLERL